MIHTCIIISKHHAWVYKYWGRSPNMGTGGGCVRGNERKRMHGGTRKDTEMSREPRAQTESDGRRRPTAAAALNSVQSWRKWHISLVFVGCFNQLTYVQAENWICLEERRAQSAGRTPLDCLRATRFVRVSANRFITAMEGVCLIHHCQCSSPLQCQLI